MKTRMMKTRIICLGVLIASSLLSHAALAACREPQTGTNAAPLFSPPLAMVVTGVGKLPFYTAPDNHCAMKAVFVIPKDQLIAYAQTNSGWTSVMYTNPKTGKDVSGWVKAARLKSSGTMGPQQ